MNPLKIKSAANLINAATVWASLNKRPELRRWAVTTRIGSNFQEVVKWGELAAAERPSTRSQELARSVRLERRARQDSNLRPAIQACQGATGFERFRRLRGERLRFVNRIRPWRQQANV